MPEASGNLVDSHLVYVVISVIYSKFNKCQGTVYTNVIRDL